MTCLVPVDLKIFDHSWWCLLLWACGCVFIFFFTVVMTTIFSRMLLVLGLCTFLFFFHVKWNFLHACFEDRRLGACLGVRLYWSKVISDLKAKFWIFVYNPKVILDLHWRFQKHGLRRADPFAFPASRLQEVSSF